MESIIYGTCISELLLPFSLQTNTFQGIVITNFTTSFAVFIYKCRDLQYSAGATIGFTAFDVLFANHRLSGYSAKKIACMNSNQTKWVNVVDKLTRDDLQPTVPIGMKNLSYFFCHVSLSHWYL